MYTYVYIYVCVCVRARARVCVCVCVCDVGNATYSRKGHFCLLKAECDITELERWCNNVL